MRAQKRAALAALFCFLTACATPPGSDELLARPEVKAGDHWSYRAINHLGSAPGESYEVRATFADGKVIVGVAVWEGGTPDGDVTWTSDWNAVVSVTEGMGMFDRIGVFDPHYGLFKFPLRVGASWSSVYEVQLPRRNDLRVRHERTVRVMGYEDVSVPAGRFRALKLVAEGTYRRLDFTRASGTTRTAVWYVPAVKRWVKLTHEEFSGTGGTRPAVQREDALVSFKVQ